MNEIESIRNKLHRLRVADAERKVFGAESHRYECASLADSAELSRLENLIGAPLPDEYRTFVSAIGNGAPGPYYGIMSTTSATNLVEEGWGRSVLGEDSPLTNDIDIAELLGGLSDWDAHVARLNEDPSYSLGFERLRETYMDRPWCCGRLPIAEYGCGTWFFLVLRGPGKETVWADCMDDATGLYCLNVGFFAWYERWLDNALEQVAKNDFTLKNAHYSFLEFGNNPRYRLA